MLPQAHARQPHDVMRPHAIRTHPMQLYAVQSQCIHPCVPVSACMRARVYVCMRWSESLVAASLEVVSRLGSELGVGAWQEPAFTEHCVYDQNDELVCQIQGETRDGQVDCHANRHRAIKGIGHGRSHAS